MNAAPSPANANTGGVGGLDALQHPDNLVCRGDPLAPHHFLRAADTMGIASSEYVFLPPVFEFLFTRSKCREADSVRLSQYEEFYSLRCPNFQRAVGVYSTYYFRKRRIEQAATGNDAAALSGRRRRWEEEEGWRWEKERDMVGEVYGVCMVCVWGESH